MGSTSLWKVTSVVADHAHIAADANRSENDLASILLGPPGLALQCRWIGFRVERHIKKADHHFLESLIAPSHFLGRVGIGRIVGGVIVVRRAFDARPLRQ